jgi:hypothetical protein
MKFTSLFMTTAISGIVAISAVPFQAFNSPSAQASTPAIKIAQGATSQDKIDQITAVKGKPESAVLLRKLYAKDLSPIGIQAGGAGMVVNLYSKKDDTTLSLCTTFDVVVAVKKGKVAKFDPKEVK